MNRARPIRLEKEVVEEIREQAGKLRFLSRLLSSPPDTALLEDLLRLGWIRSGEGPALEDLQVEFTRLFSAPGPDTVAPHQSVYTDLLRIESLGPDGLDCGLSFPGGQFRGYLGGESCSEVKRWYDAAHFNPEDIPPAMADHIATQLAFLAHLYLAEAQALESGELDEAKAFEALSNEFYHRFLDRWMATFGGKLASNRVSKFYGRIGCTLLEWVHSTASPSTGAN